MLVRLPCVRCETTDDMDPLEVGVMLGLCSSCRAEAPGLTVVTGKWSADALLRWADGWSKGRETHPTYAALSEALAKMESTPHGTLDDSDDMASWRA